MYPLKSSETRSFIPPFLKAITGVPQASDSALLEVDCLDLIKLM